MNTPLNPLPDLDTVRREVQAFLRSAPAEPEGVPIMALLPDQIRRSTDDLVLALDWFGKGQHAHLTTPQGRAAAAVLMRACFAVQAFNEQRDAYPLEAAVYAFQWAETCAQPLVNLVPLSLLEMVHLESPPASLWLSLTQTHGAFTAEQAGELAAWGVLQNLLLAAICETWEDGDREEVLASLLDGLEGKGHKTLN